MRRRGVESIVPVAVVAMSGTLLGAMVAIEATFRGQLDATVLGVYLSAQVQPFHLAVAALTLVVGALAAGQAVALEYLERQPELAMLRAIGWRRRDVVGYVAGGALALALLGAIIAGGLVAMVMLVLNSGASALLIAMSAAVIAPFFAVATAITGTLAHAFLISPAALLRGE
jgi:ABC-type antimicrobial peptide transport system permease subunit